MPSETWKHRSRRAFLRGTAGAAFALPWLEAMAQAGKSSPPQRMAFYYVPIGVIRRGFFPGEQETELVKFAGANTKFLNGARISTGFHPLKLTLQRHLCWHLPQLQFYCGFYRLPVR